MRRKGVLENPGIDPGTSRMLSGRSTIWAMRTYGEQGHLTEFIYDTSMQDTCHLTEFIYDTSMQDTCHI